jgi:hypothetical protein
MNEPRSTTYNARHLYSVLVLRSSLLTLDWREQGVIPVRTVRTVVVAMAILPYAIPREELVQYLQFLRTNRTYSTYHWYVRHSYFANSSCRG